MQFQSNSRTILHRHKITIQNFIWRHKRLRMVKVLLNKKKCYRRHYHTWFQVTLQSQTNKNIMVLTQKWSHRPEKQNWKQNITPHSYIATYRYLTKRPKIYIRERTASSTNSAWKFISQSVQTNSRILSLGA